MFMGWAICFYMTENGYEPVADFLDRLPRKHKAKAFWEIDLLAENGTKLKEPYAKHIEDELWELRIKFASNISRVFYYIPTQTHIILLHGFIKKPEGLLQMKLKRQKDDYWTIKRGVYYDF